MEKKIITADGVAVEVGMTLYLYPANGRKNGPIYERVVKEITVPWFLYFTAPIRYKSNRYQSSQHGKLYAGLDAARTAKAYDKGEPAWMRNGKFYVATSATIVNYLANKSGLDKSQIQAHKTESGTLHLSWADKKGMHKEKIRCGGLYYLKENDLAPIITQMKG